MRFQRIHLIKNMLPAWCVILNIFKKIFVSIYLIAVTGRFISQEVLPNLKFCDNQQRGGEDQRHHQGEENQQNGHDDRHLF